MDLILASGSPRRKELLSLYTTDFTICVSDFDESTVTADTPARLVEKLARGKCLAVAKDHPGAVVLGCDTVVDVGGEVFGKPRSTEDARRMLRALSGATHEVHTGVCVSDGLRTESFVDSCKVTFSPSRKRRSTPTRPPRNPMIRPALTPFRAAPPSGSTGWKGITTPSWACRSAGRPACWADSDAGRRKMKKLEKVCGNA